MRTPPPSSLYSFPANADTPQVREFGQKVAKEFHLPSQLGEILHNRGFATLSQVNDFLYPQLSMLPSPDSMKGMRQAVTCILETCRARKPIFIHGDYDVDGISATALLATFFKEIGMKSICYIPNRLEEAYGLSISSINRLVAQSEQGSEGVLISVDCGITAVDEVIYARKLGLMVIITDHHEPPAVLPDAEAILNPKQPGCEFPFSQLSGAGVAFFLMIALRKALVESGALTIKALPNLKKYLDLVALGTVADVVPLVGVNRILVRAGLEVLSTTDRFGVVSIRERCGISDRPVLSEDISFKLAPRINASGRLGTPQVGLGLLTAGSLEEARRIARDLDSLNGQRKQLEVEALSIIDKKCQAQVQAGMNGLVVYQQNCHPGVLGILASKITDQYHRPVIIFTDDTTRGSGLYLKGSGRSVAGVNLYRITEQCAPWIERFGGHTMATGLTIKKTQLENFRINFNHYTTLREDFLHKVHEIPVDYHLQDKEVLTKDFAQVLQVMQPFGEANHEPRFLLSGAQLLHPKNIKGHLAFQIHAHGHTFPGIGFHLAGAHLNFQNPVDLVFQLKRSWFRGVGREQLQAFHLVSN